MWPQGKTLDIDRVRRDNRELADYLEEIAEQPLDFRDTHPNGHSARNHQHLWMLEYAADRDPKIDLTFRCLAVRHILNRWRDRLPTYEPYQRDGFRLYLYEDMAPTVSIVAETKEGFPYQGCADFTFVEDIEDVLRLYIDAPWSARFKGSGPKPDQVLKAIERAEGSLSGAARALAIPLPEFRRIIEIFSIVREANTIRKRHTRRPATFADVEYMLPRTRIWEYRLPGIFTKSP
jgi:hypothetical protein